MVLLRFSLAKGQKIESDPEAHHNVYKASVLFPI